MRRLLSILSFLLILPVTLFGASEWAKIEPAGTRNASDIDFYVGANNEALDRMLGSYRRDCTVIPDSAATIKVQPGELALSNAAGTLVKFRRNTSVTSVGWSNIDTGAEAGTTEYYVYAIADADAETFTVKISTSASAPASSTYYRRIAYFFNNASSNIVNVGNMIGGDVANVMEVSANTLLQTSSTSYVDITGLTAQFYSSGRPIAVAFSAGVCQNNAGNGSTTPLTVDVDGTDYGNYGCGQGSNSVDGYNTGDAVGFTKIINGLAAGIHTVKMQWKADAGTVTLYGPANVNNDYSMIVREL